jgi:hypothetical protein
VAVACGLPPRPAERVNGAACAWYPVIGAGTVTSIVGADTIAKLGGVVGVDLAIRVGDVVRPYSSSMDRIGVVVLKARDRTELDSLLKDVQRELRITVRP